MKRTILLILILSLAACCAGLSENAFPEISFGMSMADAADLLNIDKSDHTVNTEDERVCTLTAENFFTGSYSDVDLGCVFVDDSLVLYGCEDITVYSSDGTPGTFDDICGLITAEFGPDRGNDPSVFNEILCSIYRYPEGSSPVGAYSMFRCWQTDDGAYIAAVSYDTGSDDGIIASVYIADTSILADSSAGSDYFFFWGYSIEEAYEAYDIDESVYSAVDFGGGITYVSGFISDAELEGYVFADGKLVALTYDYIGDGHEWAFEEMASTFGITQAGGSERMFTVMNAIVPGAYASASAFTDCHYTEIEDGSLGLMAYYGDDRFLLIITNEELLFELTDTAN